MASTVDLTKSAVERLQAEVSALQNLKLIVGLELKVRHDIQLYRIKTSSPKVSKDLAQDQRVLAKVDRLQFNGLAARGTFKSYRRNHEVGHTSRHRQLQRDEVDRPGGERQEQRAHLRKVR